MNSQASPLEFERAMVAVIRRVLENRLLNNAALTWRLELDRYRGPDGRAESELRVSFYSQDGNLKDVLEMFVIRGGEPDGTLEDAEEWFSKYLEEIIKDAT